MSAQKMDNANIPVILDLQLSQMFDKLFYKLNGLIAAQIICPVLFLSKLAFRFSYLIWRIFSLSLEHACFPQRWKQATILPLNKGKGLRSEFANYRPVSLTLVLHKVLEGIVKNKLETQASRNGPVNRYQHGFVAIKSIVSNLLVTDSIIAKFQNQRVPVDVIYFDFSKAIDRVSHSLIVCVLYSLGICNTFLA